MSIVDDIVEAAWSHTPRTLGAEGDGVPRSAWLQALQAAAWTHTPRTLTNGPTTLRAAVYSLLSADADLAGLVADRIYNSGVPARVGFPRVTFTVPSHSGWSDLDGPTGTSTARVRVSVWSLAGDEAETLDALVRSLLDGYRGRLGTVWVENSSWLSSQDVPEPKGAGADGTIYQIAIDFNITHRTGG